MKVEFAETKSVPSPVVAADSKVKQFLVNYVGEVKDPEDGNITVDMVVEVVADEFPEFVMTLAEENWIRGYQQALTDVSVGEKLKREEDEPEQHDKT